MKILYVMETGGPGGAEQAFLATILGMKERGVTCIAVSFREGWLTLKLDEHKIPRHTIHVQNSRIKCIKLLHNLIRENNIDIVHSHLLDSNFYASIACFFSRTPHVGTEHGDIHHSKKKRWVSLKTIVTSFMTQKMISVSEFGKAALIRHGMNRNRIEVLGNPFDFTSNTNKLYDESARSNYPGLESISNDDWIWIHVANLRPVKDQETLLRGFALAKSRAHQKQHLVIVGDGNLRKNLETLASDLEIDEEVHFLGFREDVEILLSLSNGFILSSLSEATPISILEAAKYKLVLLGTDAGGLPELIIDNETGYLYPKARPELLAEKIDFVISNKEMALKTAKDAHTQLQERFQTDHVTGRLASIYESVISSKKKASYP